MKKCLSYLLAFFCVVLLSNCNNETKPVEETVVAKKAIVDDWKLGIQLWTFHNFDFVTGIAKADSAGMKFIEAFPGQRLGGDFKDSTFDISLSAEGRTKVKSLLTSKGISLIAFGVVVPQSPEEWKKTFDFAKDMGIQYISAEPLKKHWDYADSLAGVYGIRIAIHDHPRESAYWHPDSVLAALKNHPNIGSCADVGHWARNGLDVVDCLKKLERHIVGLHLKDVKEFNKVESDDVLVGTGVIKFPEIFAELKRQGFSGMFSIERENNWENNVPDVMQTATYFKKEIDKLK
ncbi:MAG: sugar phosphate isomerase/epimerase family protein [Chitinophagaceae bacterium]